MFPINQSGTQPVYIYAIHWLLRNNSLPKVTVYNHENVTKMWNFKSTWGKDFPQALLSPSWVCFGLSTFQMLSTLSSILALRMADEERVDWIQQFFRWLVSSTTFHNFSLNNSTDCSVTTDTNLLCLQCGLCASKGQLAYRREKEMAIFSRLNILRRLNDHYWSLFKQRPPVNLLNETGLEASIC